ncbi:hypothetical protein PMAYCL1PPCAC_13899, partial [Pristionchus mayeri]
RHNLFGGIRRLFTAYHIYMLILHFAQAEQILPVLMDEHPQYLSSTSNWRELIAEYRSDKNVISPLHSLDDVDRWAPLLIMHLVEYYASIDFTKVIIDVGRGTTKKRSTKNLLLIEPFHDQEIGVCKVNNGAKLMNEFFDKCSDLITDRNLAFFPFGNFVSTQPIVRKHERKSEVQSEPIVSELVRKVREKSQSIVKEIEGKTREERSLKKLEEKAREKLTNIQPIVSELEGKSTEQSSWQKLADLSYGKETIVHREKMEKALIDLRGVVENADYSNKKSESKLEVVELGGFAMGTSTPSSHLFLRIPYANDSVDESTKNGKMEMRKKMRMQIQKDSELLDSLTNRLLSEGIVNENTDRGMR